MGAILVDYGAGTQVSRDGEGITNDRQPHVRRRGIVATDTACYLDVVKTAADARDGAPWRVTRGILDSANRDSLLTAAPVVVGSQTRFTWPLQPTEHVFKAGHQIGIVLTGNWSGFGTGRHDGHRLHASTRRSARSILPIVGGYAAAAASGGFPDGVAPTLAGVPADIAVDAPDARGVAVQFTPPTATDNETPGVQVTCEPASGSVFPVGVTTVTCAALDAQGNRGEATFRVTVTGPPAPPSGPGTAPPAEAPASAVVVGRRLLVVLAGTRRLDVPCTLEPAGAAPLLADPGRRRQDAGPRVGGRAGGGVVGDRAPGARRRDGAPGAAGRRAVRDAPGDGRADRRRGEADARACASLLHRGRPSRSRPTRCSGAAATTLPANGTASLRALRDLLAGVRRVTCTGYTDDRGAAAANLQLGLARARSVCAVLTQGTDIAGRATSKGESAPRASNRTAAGRAANRRVTVTVQF